MSPHNYRLRYAVNCEPGNFTIDEIKGKKGGADAIMVTSIMRSADGSYSQSSFTCDGERDGLPMSDAEVFKAWLTMGMGMARQASKFEDARYRELLGAFSRITAEIIFTKPRETQSC